MNNLATKSPEERKAIAAKSVATRRKNIAIRKAEELEEKSKVGHLKKEIDALESQLKKLKLTIALNEVTKSIKINHLLNETEIAKNSTSWSVTCGIYFLLKKGRVVYVGQSVNVFGRIAQHSNSKNFDSIAWVACEKSNLDKLESLYIHTLRPPLNGVMANGANVAPLSLRQLTHHN